MMSEFGQYRIGEEELERLEEQTKSRPLLHSKLKDLRLLFGAFRAAMGEGMITAEELLPVLCRVLPRSRKIRGQCDRPGWIYGIYRRLSMRCWSCFSGMESG